MKKLLLVFCLIFALKTQAQTTYYWKGAAGAALAPTDWQITTNWNTAIDGSGAARTTPADSDILIFDGAANASATSYVGNIPTETIGTLKLTNNAVVHLMTIAAPPVINNPINSVTAYGGNTFTVAGTGFNTNLKKGDFIFTTQALNVQVLAVKDDNTITTSNENAIAAVSSYSKYTTLYPTTLTVDAGSTLNMGGSVTGTNFNSFAIITKGGAVSGAIVFPSRASYCKLYCTIPGALHFTSTGTLTYNTSTNGQKNFLLGNTLGLYDSNGVFIYNDGNGSNNRIPGYSGNAGIIFDSGSTFTNTAGNQLFIMGNSWQANGTDLVFTPGVSFAPGSNYVANGSPVYSPYWPVGLTAGLTLGNVEFKNALPSVSTTTTSATFNATVENLTIGGTTAASTIAGNLFIKGNLINSSTNATSAAMNFTGNVFLVGTSNQNITSSTGSLTFANLVVADKAIATLGSNIAATNLSIVGKLNFGAFKVNGTGTGTVSTYAPYSKATTVTAFTKGSNVIGGVNSNGAGTSVYEYPIGATISNATYIPAGTIYRSYTGSGAGVMSDFVKASADISENATALFSVVGSSYTTSSADLASSAPNFANYVTDINSTVLPLDLLSFSGAAGLNGVKLLWSTANEVNVKSYAIERRNSKGEFSELARFSAKASSLNTYSFTDGQANNGLNYYRLKITDTDGTSALSNVVVVNVSLSSVNANLTVYPNPATNAIFFNTSGSAGTFAKVTSLDGKTSSFSLMNIEGGRATLDVSSLPTGLYILELTEGGKTQQAKFLKK